MKYISQEDFYKKVIGKSIDIDRVYGSQCVDLFKDFIIEISGVNPGAICIETGYAKDIYNCFDKLPKVNKYFDKVSINQLQDGDWVIWGNCRTAPKSHIAMFREDVKGKGLFLGQNQGKQKGIVNETILSYNGIIGVLRPKIYVKKEKPIYNGNSIVDYLNSKNIDSSFSNRRKLAVQYGIVKNSLTYIGTAIQNINLLRKMRGF